MIHFTKMHGAGNDYIYVNTLLYNIPDPAKASIEWSRPHFGIGSDGLVLIGRPSTPDADFSMRIFNNDGSEAMMCGNASRCIGKYLHDKGLTDKNPIRLETLSGIKILNLHIADDGSVDTVTVDMGEPMAVSHEQLAVSDGDGINLELTADDREFVGTFVSMGNPHFVIFLDEDVEKFPIEKYGRLLEHHQVFPQRCNIEFAEIVGSQESETGCEAMSSVRRTIRMRVWERGSGVTLACGTGACATAVAAGLTGRSGRKTSIRMDGGTLGIEWNELDDHVYMTGPAEISFEGEISNIRTKNEDN